MTIRIKYYYHHHFDSYYDYDYDYDDQYSTASKKNNHTCLLTPPGVVGAAHARTPVSPHARAHPPDKGPGPEDRSTAHLGVSRS